MLDYVRCVACLAAVGTRFKNQCHFLQCDIPKYGWNFALTFFPPLNLEIVCIEFRIRCRCFWFQLTVWYTTYALTEAAKSRFIQKGHPSSFLPWLARLQRLVGAFRHYQSQFYLCFDGLIKLMDWNIDFEYSSDSLIFIVLGLFFKIGNIIFRFTKSH